MAKTLARQVLKEIFTQQGLETPAAPPLPEPELCQLDAGQQLLATDDPSLLAALQNLATLPSRDWLSSLKARLLRDFPGARWVMLARDQQELGALALQLAGGPGTAAALQLDALDYRSRREDLWEAIASAGDRGCLIDESRSAFRLAAGAWSLGGSKQPDFILLGPSIASAWPCAALLAFGSDTQEPTTAPAPPTLPTQAMALASLQALETASIHLTLQETGEALRTAAQAGSARENLRISLAGPAAAMSFVCQGQENAEAALIAHHLQLELRAQGLNSGGDLLPWADLQGEVLATTIRGIDAALARMRTLLIEHNSYLSGGIPYVFPGGDPRLRDRGVARYRYPRMADTRVEAEGDKLVIRFGPAEMGEVTSSGFYLPTLLRGDLDLQLSYRLTSWDPGPDSSCIALFLQNEASTARYYSQRMSSGGPEDPHCVLASMNTVLSEQHPTEGMAGQFRLSREGSTLRAWHRCRPTEEWLLLAEENGKCREDLIVGAKIWSKVRAGELAAELRDLRIRGEIPEEQIPSLEARPDPRGSDSA